MGKYLCGQSEAKLRSIGDASEEKIGREETLKEVKQKRPAVGRASLRRREIASNSPHSRVIPKISQPKGLGNVKYRCVTKPFSFFPPFSTGPGAGVTDSIGSSFRSFSHIHAFVTVTPVPPAPG